MSRVIADFDRAFRLLSDAGEALDSALAGAKAELPADRYRVLEATAKKAITTLERFGAQFAYLVHQYERLSKPPPHRGGPGTVVKFRPRRR